MSSIFAIFDIGRSAIFASQTALGVASNNIANVNTPGYSRQDVILKIASPIELHGDYVGRGVGDVQIRRHFDGFIYRQIIGQETSYGRSFALERGLSHIEQIFNEAQEMGLANTMQEYFNAWQDVANNPEGNAQRSSLLVKAQAFVNVAKQMEEDVKSTLKFINDEIGDTVNQINVLTKNIASVNDKIIEIEAGGTETANIFRDERERLMKELAELVDYDWNEGTDGAVTIVAGRRSLVAGITSYNLSTSLNINGDRQVYSGGVDITEYIHSGKLGGFIASRSDIENNTLHDLRKMVASIVKETNIKHYEGYGLDGSTNNNFFSPLELYTLDTTSDGTSSASITSATIPVATRSSLTLDEYDISFVDSGGTLNYEVRRHDSDELVTSGVYDSSGTTITYEGIQLTIAGSAAEGDSFFVSPLSSAIQNFQVNISDGDKVAAASSSTTLPGDNSNALDIVNLYGSAISDLGSVTYNDHYAEIVSTVGTLTQAATDTLKFEDNLLLELKNRRESVSGVSLDEEAANLIRYQRAYEAGARLIKITDELLDTIMNL